jgi:serine/threonine protein kinase
MGLNQQSIIGHYKILRPLGKGDMGEVYLAKDTKLKHEVALKILPESGRTHPVQLRRLRTEAEASAKLNHPDYSYYLQRRRSRNPDFYHHGICSR